MRHWLLVGLLLTAGCLDLGEPAEPAQTAPNAAIATTHPLAAEAGAAVLLAGGNAFDAAATIQFVLNVVEPGMSGIGGGAFFMAYVAATGQLVALDGREVAPAATPADVFVDNDPLPDDLDAHPSVRGTAVGVPGTLALWDEVLQRHGTITLADAMEPAIRIAEEGFSVDWYLAYAIDVLESKFRSWPASAQLYLPGATCVDSQVAYTSTAPVDRCVGGAPLAEGATLRNADLAATFRAIQTDGIAAFYHGPIAQAIVDAVTSRDGLMTTADLADYEVVERTPTRIAYRGLDIATFPAPGGGLILAQILGMLDHFDLASMETADRVHVIAEATTLAYADRGAYEGDPAFVDVPEAGMLHPEYLAMRAGLIKMGTTQAFAAGDPWAYQPGTGGGPSAPSAHEGDHTTHFVVTDTFGNVASVTSTIEAAFGSGMVVPGYGFLLNNEMTDFAVDPEAANAPAGGKRPRSSMSPTIVFEDGRPVMAVGASGGPRIITGTMQVLTNIIDLGMGPQGAVNALRFHSPGSPEIEVEDVGFGSRIDRDLAERGHALTSISSVANAQVLSWNGRWVPAADDRSAQGATWATS